MRRLLPEEAETLQGFPAGWTAPGKVEQRWEAMGRAVTVPVIEWIGNRLAASEPDGMVCPVPAN